MARLAYIMCKKCVKALNSIGNKMSEYLQDGFDMAIKRDMSPEMNDEGGMFHLFMYELIAETVKQEVDLEVMQDIVESLNDELFVNIPNAIMQIFQDNWS